MRADWFTGAIDDLVFRLFGESLAKKFVVFGGIEHVLARGVELRKKGITPVYNLIDEHVKNPRRVRMISAIYTELVRGMSDENRGAIAIKPSAFGMELGAQLFARTLHRFAYELYGHTLEIEIDAESRGTLRAAQDAVNAIRQRVPEGITFRSAFQMHLPVALRNELIEECGMLYMPLRIVKGSGLYDIGDEEVGQVEVIAHYIETFWRQVQLGKQPHVATVRDKTLVASFKQLVADGELEPSQFTFEFLDGPLGRSLMEGLAREGYRVACYVPFVDPSVPDAWKGYIKRRIAFGRKLVIGF